MISFPKLSNFVWKTIAISSLTLICNCAEATAQTLQFQETVLTSWVSIDTTYIGDDILILWNQDYEWGTAAMWIDESLIEIPNLWEYKIIDMILVIPHDEKLRSHYCPSILIILDSKDLTITTHYHDQMEGEYDSDNTPELEELIASKGREDIQNVLTEYFNDPLVIQSIIQAYETNNPETNISLYLNTIPWPISVQKGSYKNKISIPLNFIWT